MTIVQLEKGAELEVVYLKTGKLNSSQDKCQRDHKKLVQFSKDPIDITRKYQSLRGYLIFHLRGRYYLYLL